MSAMLGCSENSGLEATPGGQLRHLQIKVPKPRGLKVRDVGIKIRVSTF